MTNFFGDGGYASNFSFKLEGTLSATLKYALSLKSAATACADTFIQLSHERWQHVVVLDSDIIHGGISQLVDHKPEDPSEILEYGPLKFLGDASARYLIDLMPRFVVPSGATAQILTQHVGARSAGARAFLGRVGTTQKEVENDVRGGALSAGSSAINRSDVYNLLSQDATQFPVDLSENKLIERVVSRASPLGEYMTVLPTAVEESLRVLRDSFALLRGKESARNNFHDAMNTASVAALMASCQATRYMPIFITQTRFKSSLNDVMRSGGLRFGTSTFNDAIFLVLFETLLANTEQRYVAATDLAHQLATDAERLTISVRAVMSHCAAKRSDGIEIKSMSDLPNASWRRLLLQHTALSKRWSPVFAPVQLAARRDLAGHILARQQLRKQHGTSIAQVLDVSRPTDDQLWDLFVDRTESVLSGVPTDAPSPSLRFSFPVRKSSGLLLRDTIAARNVDSSPGADDFSVRHSYDCDVVPSIGNSGSVLRVVSFRKPEVSTRRYLRICWPYALPVKDALKKCMQTLRAIADPAESLVVMGHTDTQIVVLAGFESGIGGSADEDFDAFHVVEFRRGLTRAFVDLKPIGGVELQFSMTIGEDALTLGKIDMISNAISESSAPRLPRARSLLLSCFRALYVVDPSADDRSSTARLRN